MPENQTTTLQKENADTHEIRDALITAIEKLQTLQDTHSTQFTEALVYFLQLILQGNPCFGIERVREVGKQLRLFNLFEDALEDANEYPQGFPR